jgi:type II secretory pathway predicted ATPase ExeA
MHLEDIGLRETPFHTTGWPAKFIEYESQQSTFRFLREVLAAQRGAGLLYGPETSGKSTLISQFVRELPADLPVAVVEGARTKTPQLLSRILAQFGYAVSLNSVDELLSMLSVLLVQQTRSEQPPILILRNIDEMYPSALCALCKLAALTVQNRFALRIILVGRNPSRRVLDSPGMRAIAERLIGDLELGPLSEKESLTYLHAKLQSCGVEWPDNIFPVDVCDELYLASSGWPGVLDEFALSAIDNADGLPVQPKDVDRPDRAREESRREWSVVRELAIGQETPRLMVTSNGKTLQEFVFDGSRALIGRSALCDIRITGRFASKLHVLLFLIKGTILLVDLKSTNGTLVNSRRVRSVELQHDDVISLGEHRIKVNYPEFGERAQLGGLDTADTASMKGVDDVRRQKLERELHVADTERRKA